MIKNNAKDIKIASTVSFLTCIYLPLIITVLCYKGSIYKVGTYTTVHVLLTIFVVESVKLIYLTTNCEAKCVRKSKNSKNKIKDFVKSLVFTLACVIIFFLGIILFGAPVLTQHEETIMLAFLLATLTVYPLGKYVGVEQAVQFISGVKSANDDPIIEMLTRNILLTLCGTWAGAIVIPLDWDRPWQVWPVPCFLGALTGYIFANLVTLVKNIGRISFSSVKI